MRIIAATAVWILASCLSAETLGYLLHRLLHNGRVPFLSRNHMKHHMVLYGPLQQQQSATYHDATTDSVSLGNIGLEWLAPSAFLLIFVLGIFRLFDVRAFYQAIYVGVTLAWSFLMFSHLHDVMHVEGYWLEENRLLKRWFVSARNLHEIHHRVLSDQGLMNKNFGIGLFFFDRLFGTLEVQEPAFNPQGYRVACERFGSTINSRRPGYALDGAAGAQCPDQPCFDSTEFSVTSTPQEM